MSPRYKGNSDDWLDDEGASAAGRSRSAVKRFKHAKAEFLPTEAANATVIEVHPNQCRVRMDSDASLLLCAYRRAGVVKKDGARERTFVAVGDRVKITAERAVEGVCVRRNKLSRPAPGREEKSMQHVIAANLDKVVVVASAKAPEFSSGIVDRFLVGIQAAGIEPLICVTKMDLAETQAQSQKDTMDPRNADDESAPRPWTLYRELGFQVVEVCSKKNSGIDELRASLLGRAVLFCGESGVGKTSLLRALLQEEVGRVGEVSQATGKGRHTTTGTVLLGGPENSQWMDSPGVREFGLVEVESDELSGFFPEFKHLRCQVTGCKHHQEEGCQAVQLPRHSSYVRILESLLNGS
jgi:ribosome biogenesis GTPase